jgi:hypothetical protein
MKQSYRIYVLAVLFVLFATSLSVVSLAQGTNSGVAPPQSNPYGSSYGEWGSRWWQWAYSLPVSENPLFDETGAMAANGQPYKQVFFLAGVFNATGQVERTITVPTGTSLFLPLVNYSQENIGVDPPLTVAQMYDAAAGAISLITELNATLDGMPMTDLFSYRGTSPQPYTYVLPTVDNILQLFGYDVSGPVYPAVSDGYWLMLRPLSAGQHTLNFGGTIGDPVNFTLDITYHITVAPKSH